MKLTDGLVESTSTTTTWETPIETELGSGEPDEGRFSESKCRADDSVRCADGSRSICADQICDGIKDCDDGRDEDNCPSGSKIPNYLHVVLGLTLLWNIKTFKTVLTFENF